MQDAIERIAAAVRSASYRKEKCTLLIGAGCSITAGIKSAPGIVADIRESRGKTDRTDLSYYYDKALERAKQRDHRLVQPTYGDCMSVLPPGPQRELLRGYIDRAKLNWAHVGIGALVSAGYVDRILTTNFDPLIARGCAVFHEFPAVYDLTMSPKLKLEDLADKAVFHLHGQRNGFSLLNSEPELRAHKQHVKPLFDHARGNRTWIVCGYSGDNDPLMELIVEQDRYDYELFWIDIKDEPPARLRPLTERCEETFCRYFRFPGADQFFIRLARHLELFPFQFMDRPIEHLQALIGNFAEFPLDATELGLDLLKDARERLKRYQSLIASTEKSADQAAAEQIAGIGVAQERSTDAPSTGSNELSDDMHATIALMAGNKAYEDAMSTERSDTALVGFQEAARYYAKAFAIKPSMHEALYNWGNALDEQAQRSPDEAAHRLLAEAEERFAQALAIKPDMHEALNNLGNVLNQQAQYSPDEAAHRLWAEAEEKFAQALAIKPDKPEALNNWGNALNQQAQRSPDEAAHRRWAEAGEKFTQALAIKPDMREVLNNWGNALNQQAQRSPDEAAHRRWAEAGEKYAQALAIKPDMHEALNNWGAALNAQAQRNDGAERDRLMNEAYEKCLLAESIAPGEAAYNLACIQAMRNELEDMTHWLDQSHAAGKLPTREHIAADKDFDSVRETPQFKAWLAKMGWLE